MTEPDETTELDHLRQQVSELTQRVFRLEQILEGGASASYSQEAVHYPTMQLDDLGEPPPHSYPSPLHEGVSNSPAPGLPTVGEPASPLVEETPVVETVFRSVPVVEEKPAEFSKPPETSKRPEREVSLENRIGGQWLNRVGIVAVLVGLSYFLKLAFENDWIGPPIRVAIGLAIGLGLLLWSNRFRKRGFNGFSYSLKAIAFGAMYLSLWAAFQFFHLITAPVAFGAMVAVTVTAAALSLRQDSELLAAFALVGGFLTPVLVSTNQNQEVSLLSYLALLDLATVWLVAIKGWRRILLGSLVGTALLSAGWAVSYYTEPQLPVTLGFASFFFLLYLTAPFLGRKREGDQDLVTLSSLVLLNAAIYLVACFAMLYEGHHEELAWVTGGVAALFWLLTPPLRKREPAGPALVSSLYLALGVLFLTIAIPLELGGYWMTLAWALEGGALFFASHFHRRMLLRSLGAFTLGLAVVRLIASESVGGQRLIVNPRFGLYLLAIATLALLAYLALHEGGEENRKWAGAAVVCLNLLALTALHFEVAGYFEPQLHAAGLSPAESRGIAMTFGFTYSAIWMIYGSALMLIGFWKRSPFLRWQAILLLALTVVKVFAFDISELQQGYRIAAFIALGVILLAVSYFYQRSRTRPVVEELAKK